MTNGNTLDSNAKMIYQVNFSDIAYISIDLESQYRVRTIIIDNNKQEDTLNTLATTEGAMILHVGDDEDSRNNP